MISKIYFVGIRLDENEKLHGTMYEIDYNDYPNLMNIAEGCAILHVFLSKAEALNDLSVWNTDWSKELCH